MYKSDKPPCPTFCLRMFNNYIEEFVQIRGKKNEGDGMLPGYFWLLNHPEPGVVITYMNSKWFRGKDYFEDFKTFSHKVHFFIIAQCTTINHPK